MEKYKGKRDIIFNQKSLDRYSSNINFVSVLGVFAEFILFMRAF